MEGGQHQIQFRETARFQVAFAPRIEVKLNGVKHAEFVRHDGVLVDLRYDFERSAELLDRFVITTLIKITLGQVCIDDERQRVEFNRPSCFRDRAIKLAEEH
ncbi:MAG: hypothetical protein M3505_00755 [Verrucomicrobiota bacterium]|nr:hypothetical protein [Verrucomicrobiota bacterium]